MLGGLLGGDLLDVQASPVVPDLHQAGVPDLERERGVLLRSCGGALLISQLMTYEHPKCYMYGISLVHVKTLSETTRVILNLRSDQAGQLDQLVKFGVAPSRNALIETIIGGFLSDLKDSRQSKDTALGNFIGYILLVLGIALIASLFSDG